MCPSCGKNAPIVYRGMIAYCTACGRPRAPLVERSVNMAGQPSRVGGAVANVAGWLIIAGGVATALLLGTLISAIWAAGATFAWVLAAIVALGSAAIGGSLVYGGKSLHKSGTEVRKNTHERAIFALAQNRGGVLSAHDVAAALGMTPPEADALLTDFAKTDSDRVRLEVDDAGAITFVFPQHGWLGPRVAAPGADPYEAPVDADAAQAARRKV